MILLKKFLLSVGKKIKEKNGYGKT